MPEYHIAQLNIAKARAEMETAIMSGFVSRLEEINAIADQSPGFVWRLQTEEGDATAPERDDVEPVAEDEAADENNEDGAR